MILHFPISLSEQQVSAMAKSLHATWFRRQDYYVLVTSHTVQHIPSEIQSLTTQTWTFPTDMQLTSRNYEQENRRITIGDTYIGGDGKNQLMIAGPCAVENTDEIEQTCQLLVSMGIKVLRAGCFKPRTSPYTFHGLEEEGLKILARMRDKYGLLIATEMYDASHADLVTHYADIVQIGAKSMYDRQLLIAAAKSGKPILLKRSFSATLQEFVQAAEQILALGNEQVILCERGIRTFETATRFTLDLCGVVWLKQHINLPIILDPSHAMGYQYGVPDLARACTAAGIDGLLIETHPNPALALSDSPQQLTFEQFRQLYSSLQPIASAVGKRLV